MAVKKSKKKPDPFLMRLRYDKAIEILDQAARRVMRLKHELQTAKEEVLRAELAIAREAKIAALDGPNADNARSWLVWWWNNGETSPRGDRPCVMDYSEIPSDAIPVE